MAREKGKICEVVDAGIIDKLAGKAEYSCARCGAKAHDSVNVCEPELLKPGR